MINKLPKFSLIVAVGKNREIGYKGDLPWGHNVMRADMSLFANVTSMLEFSEARETVFTPSSVSAEEKKSLINNPSNVVIMGRNSWESIPVNFRPLPKRKNIIITRNPNYKLELKSSELANLAHVATSLDEALELANSFNPKQIFVTGGTHFYTEALKHPNCTNLFITEVLSDSTWEYDTFFPEYKHLNLKAYNITNEAINWMTNNDALFVKNKLPQLVHNKEEEYIIDGNEVKYKFMLYLKQNN